MYREPKVIVWQPFGPSVYAIEMNPMITEFAGVSCGFGSRKTSHVVWGYVQIYAHIGKPLALLRFLKEGVECRRDCLNIRNTCPSISEGLCWAQQGESEAVQTTHRQQQYDKLEQRKHNMGTSSVLHTFEKAMPVS